MKALKILVIVLVGIILLFLILMALLPSKIDVSRTAIIDAPREIVYENVNNLKNWEKWSPWHKMDSNAVFTYSDMFTGTGAIYTWESNNSDLGSGKYTILESYPYDSLKSEIAYNDGVVSNGFWYFTDVDGKTKVNWGVKGDVDFLSRWVTLFIDSWMGPVFEQGLSSLKEVSEKAKDMVNMELVSTEKVYGLAIKDSIDMSNMAEVSEMMSRHFGSIIKFMQNNSIKTDGYPFACNHAFDGPKWIFSIGFPVANNQIAIEDNMYIIVLPAGKAVKTVYKGPYEEMDVVYSGIIEYISSNNLEMIGDSWEYYLNSPHDTKPEDLITHIYFPVR